MAEFTTELKKSFRVTIPPEIVRYEKLKEGDLVRIVVLKEAENGNDEYFQLMMKNMVEDNERERKRQEELYQQENRIFDAILERIRNDDSLSTDEVIEKVTKILSMKKVGSDDYTSFIDKITDALQFRNLLPLTAEISKDDKNGSK